MLTIRARQLDRIQANAQRAFYLSVLGCVVSLISSALSPWSQSIEAAGFDLVPDRPGYSDSTQTVAPRHWHIELGNSWLIDSDVQIDTLIRYGLARGWELRLRGPTLTQGFATSTPIDPDPAEIPLAVGGASLGAKWSYQRSKFSSSIVMMVGIPVTGAESALSPDPLFLVKGQLEYPLNDRINIGLTFKSALLDETTPALESAYGEELGGLWGIVGAISWVEIDWSLYAQSGGEIIADTFTPLLGVGGTLRVAHSVQFDLSIDAPLAADGVNPRYGSGITIGW
jgi:hypothetical protein